jgi:hypothetical protein
MPLQQNPTKSKSLYWKPLIEVYQPIPHSRENRWVGCSYDSLDFPVDTLPLCKLTKIEFLF